MSRYFPTSGECGHHVLFGNIPARTYAGEQLQLSLVDIPPDGVAEAAFLREEQVQGYETLLLSIHYRNKLLSDESFQPQLAFLGEL